MTPTLPKTLSDSLGPPILFTPPLGKKAYVTPGPGMLQWNLNFHMQMQLQTNWCWAATSASVHGYYQSSSTAWTQCLVANAELGQTSCCADGSTGDCNVPWFLDRALTRVGYFDSKVAGSIPVADIQTELSANRPIGCRVGWSSGGGHFMVMDGLAMSATNSVTIRDPIFGTSTMDYAVFESAYQTTGTWTHTYLTLP